MNIHGLWNESSEFALFLKGKFALIYECVGLRARLANMLAIQGYTVHGIVSNRYFYLTRVISGLFVWCYRLVSCSYIFTKII